MRVPRISVIMSVYNEELYLREAVKSILEQTFSDFEFIIVNDGSTDNTQRILDGYTDPRIVRLNNEMNIGLVKSLNRGLKVARGEFVARMDADDVSQPRRFEKQVKYLESHLTIGVLGTQMEQIDGIGRSMAPFQPPGSHNMIAWKMLFECSIAHATVMMRRALVDEVGGYDTSFIHIEDAELWSRLIYVTRFANLPEPLYVRRWHPNSICSLHANTQYRVGRVIRQRLIERILKKEAEPDIHEWFSRSLEPMPKLGPFKAKRVAELVYGLYQAIVSNDELSTIDKQFIRRDAAKRLYNLIRPWVQSVSVWGVLARAYYLDPLVVLRVAIGRLRRLYNKQFRSSY